MKWEFLYDAWCGESVNCMASANRYLEDESYRTKCDEQMGDVYFFFDDQDIEFEALNHFKDKHIIAPVILDSDEVPSPELTSDTARLWRSAMRRGRVGVEVSGNTTARQSAFMTWAENQHYYPIVIPQSVNRPALFRHHTFIPSGFYIVPHLSQHESRFIRNHEGRWGVFIPRPDESLTNTLALV